MGESGGATSTISIIKKILAVKNESANKSVLSDEEFHEWYGLKLWAVDDLGKNTNSQTVENAESFSIDSTGDEGYEKCRAWSSADVHRTSAFLIFKSLFLNTHAK